MAKWRKITKKWGDEKRGFGIARPAVMEAQPLESNGKEVGRVN